MPEIIQAYDSIHPQLKYNILVRVLAVNTTIK
jgi:hypothetical protein